MQFFRPENHFLVTEALLQAIRQERIEGECDCLISGPPPMEATQARRRLVNDGDQDHSVAIV